jgi:hypothetical protein
VTGEDRRPTGPGGSGDIPVAESGYAHVPSTALASTALLPLRGFAGETLVQPVPGMRFQEMAEATE